MPRKYLVGTPVHNWSADCRYIDSLVNTARMAVERGYLQRELYYPGEAILPHARNELVRLALHHGYDDLIFIDADQDWQAEDVFRLLSYPVDCVGAAIRKKTDDAELYNVKSKAGLFGFARHPDYDILTSPDMALGTGFIRFSRKALQTLWDNSEPYLSGADIENRWIFDARPMDTGKRIKELVGEDTMVSLKLRQHGIATWVDPEMTLGHMGLKRFEGNFGDWLVGEQQKVNAA